MELAAVLLAVFVGAVVVVLAVMLWRARQWTMQSGRTSICGSECNVGQAVTAQSPSDCMTIVSRTGLPVNAFVYDGSKTTYNCQAQLVLPSTLSDGPSNSWFGYRGLEYAGNH
jgi:hypothetical protein